MLAHGPGILSEARAQGRAVPAFTTYTLESTRAICEAATRTGLPVMLAAGSSSFRGSSREMLAAAAIAAAREAEVPVGVHLDHSTDVAEIRACLELGYTSVMVDGSQLPFDENVALTRTVVDAAHAAGVWVEAELGAMTGDEDSSSDAEAGGLTDPEQAAEFVGQTGVDALAAAVGTVHGFTTAPVHVDLERVRRICALTDVPFVLHGASGLSDDELAAAVAAGVAKVNINAELRRAYHAALAARSDSGSDDITGLQDELVAAMAGVAEQKLILLSGPNATKER